MSSHVLQYESVMQPNDCAERRFIVPAALYADYNTTLILTVNKFHRHLSAWNTRLNLGYGLPGLIEAALCACLDKAAKISSVVSRPSGGTPRSNPRV